MKHQFLDKKRIDRRKKIFKTLIVLVVFIVLVLIGLFSFSSNFLNFIGKPIWKTKNFANQGIVDLGYVAKTKSAVFAENKKLAEENSNLKILMLDYQILKSENDDLKKIIGRIPTSSNYVLGYILVKPNNSPYDTVIIDIGENYEIKEGDLVYANGDIPVGFIAKPYINTSLVSLYSSPDQKIQGFLASSNSPVDLFGRGGGNFAMAVPSELEIKEGDKVLFSKNPSEIIAIVNKVISEPADPFKKVLLSSPINIYNLKWVEVKK